MKTPIDSVIGYQSLVVEQWVKAVANVIDIYAVCCDPRPDLAKPARQMPTGLGWWW